MRDERTSMQTPMQTTQKNDLFPKFLTHRDPVLEEMKRAAFAFCADVFRGNPKHWLSFVGSSGTGKTMLAGEMTAWAGRTILNDHAHLKSGVMRFFWPRLLSGLRDQQYYLLQDIIMANWVMIDEVIIEHDPSGYAKDKLCEILSSRVGKWTVLTSNLSLERLGELDTRIPSRMVRDGSKVIDCTTTDYALRNL